MICPTPNPIRTQVIKNKYSGNFCKVKISVKSYKPTDVSKCLLKKQGNGQWVCPRFACVLSAFPYQDGIGRMGGNGKRINLCYFRFPAAKAV